MMNNKLQTGLVAIFLLFLGLMTKPLIAIPDGQIFSMPTLLVYFFIIWVALIITMALYFQKGNSKDTPNTDTK